MSTFLRPVCCLALLWTAACAGSAPAPAPAALQHTQRAGRITAADGGAEPVLVVTRDGDGKLETHWLRVADGGLEVERRRTGAFFYADGELWRWTVRAEPLMLPGCGDGSAEGAVGYSERVWVERADGSRHMVFAGSSADGEPQRSLDERVTLVGSLGPVLVARMRRHADGCGAHGSTVSEPITFDLRQGRHREILFSPNDRETLAIPLEAATKALTLAAGDGDLPPDPAEVELRSVEPRHRRGQGMRLDYIFTAPACYACGDGRWEDYARTTTVEARATPSDLRGFAAPNTTVETFARTRPDLTVVGWTARSVRDVAQRGPALRDLWRAR